MRQERGGKKDRNTTKERPRARKKKESESIDEKVQSSIALALRDLADSFRPVEIADLDAFQRKQVYRYFAKSNEYEVKTYQNGEVYLLKIFPVGALRRLAEQKAQEVLMRGEPAVLPPMGSFERFIIHNYLKNRGGVRTESIGEGTERHVQIFPVYGRTLKKAKRRLM